MEEGVGILKFLVAFAVIWFGGIVVLAQQQNQTVTLNVDAGQPVRTIPSTLFGLFFEEINHAGAGGLWAELVSNRGFEAGGPNTPSNIDPWSIIGDERSVIVVTDRSSIFERNKIALRMEVFCDREGTNQCPKGGVGVYNPGYWGMVHYRMDTRDQPLSDNSSIQVHYRMDTRDQPLSDNSSIQAMDAFPFTFFSVLFCLYNVFIWIFMLGA